MARQKMKNHKLDNATFRRTAKRTRKKNIDPGNPRGGTRL